MKTMYTVGIVVLLGIAVTWWLAQSEAVTNQMPVSGASSGLDASPQVDGNGESRRQEASRQPDIPSGGSGAGRDVRSANAAATSGGNVALSTAETGEFSLPVAKERSPGVSADTKSSEPSEIDKTDCEAAARTLEASLAIYDVTPTLAVAYARANPNAPTSGFGSLQTGLLAPLCSGTYAFDRRDYAATMEFVAISSDSHVRILVGDSWISEGTIVSPLSEQDQAFFANPSLQRRRQQGIGSGQNVSREVFERRLAQNPRALISGPEVVDYGNLDR